MIFKKNIAGYLASHTHNLMVPPDSHRPNSHRLNSHQIGKSTGGFKSQMNLNGKY